MPNKIVFICGSPGAGKSSVIDGISSKKGYKVVNVGTLMTDLAVKKRYVKGRDELRSLEKGRFNELQAAAFRKISEMDGNIILDTHATVEQNGRYFPGISIWQTMQLKGLAGFVYIDALTQDIAKRRKGDRTRRREKERIELIDVQRLMNISILSACSTFLNLPLYIIFNEQGKLEASIGQLKAQLKDIFGA
jgi:adenylate kinase